jgi:hypothetical protein
MPFDPPGFLEDLTAQQKEDWSDWISAQIDAAREGDPQNFSNDGPREQFFNADKEPLAADAVEQDIFWTAFPRQVQVSSVSDKQRWTRAEA